MCQDHITNKQTQSEMTSTATSRSTQNHVMDTNSKELVENYGKHSMKLINNE